METVKLNFNNYVPGRSVRENVIACLPGELEPIKVKGRNDEFLLDKKNSRLYVIDTQTCSPKDKEAWLPNSTEYDGKDRKRLYTRKVLPKGMNIVDYDAYVIAAAEYDGDDPWYERWDLGGDYLNMIHTDSFNVGGNKTFHYSELAMFDRQEYLNDYAESNLIGKDELVDLSLMEKYIYQRTHIDVDVHDENLLVYQDEGGFEYLLAAVNWFHDGLPTGITDDEDFLRRWDALDQGLKDSYSEKAVDKIRKNMTIYDIDASVIIDKSRKEKSVIDEAKDFVEYGRGKFLHLLITARFGRAFSGPLNIELRHERSGFITKWIMDRPGKEYCDGNLLGDETGEFSIEQVLGKGYRIPDDCKDFITVKMFNENREIFRKDLQIRRIGA